MHTSGTLAPPTAPNARTSPGLANPAATVTLSATPDRASFGLSGIVLLAVLLALAAALRFSGLDREGLWGDEYIQVAEYHLPPHYTAHNAISHHGLGPLDFLIGWVVHRISPTVWAYRLPAATFGVLSIAVCFLLVRRLASWQAGLVAAALLCFCRMHLILSQEVRPYSIALLLILTTLVLLLRAFEKPTLHRVAAYGFLLFLCPMTRSFTGVVLQLTLGIVLTVAFWRSGRTKPVSVTRPTLKRLWIATLVAGLATLPMFGYMLYSLRVYTVLPSGFKQNFWETGGGFFDKLFFNGGVAWEALFASYGPIVLTLCLIGILHALVSWRDLALPARCTFAAMLLIGPIFLLVFTAMVQYQTIFHRYNFYLMPIVATFTAIAVSAILQQMTTMFGQEARARRMVAFVVLAGVLGYPAAMSAKETQSYRRIDWRTCAEDLGEIVKPNDVIMVLSDRPFGRPQITFRGKHDWPKSQRPLAEALWTFATSDSHFERLCKQTGRSYTVITYMMAPQGKIDYLTRGLQEPPPLHRVTKYRGMDVLIDNAIGGELFEDMIRSCDTLLALPREHKSANVAVLSLKARLLHHLHRDTEAAESYQAARGLVPSTQLDLFDHLTSSWTNDLLLVQ